MFMAQGRRIQTGDMHAATKGRAQLRRWRLLLGVLAVAALGLAAFGAPGAQAATPEANVQEWACDHVTVKYSGFENLPGYIATIKVTVDGTTISYTTHKFTGPEATITVPIAVPPGHHSIDVFAKWKGNNIKGGHDQPLKGGITCEADPEYEIVKKQRRGGKGAYSTETIPNGKVGEVVEYGIVVKNTGNVPLKFSNFSDPNCDEGTITGGPGESAIAPGGFSNFFCKHTLTEADHTAGKYCNIASVTGEPEEGGPKSKESNEVCVELPTPKNKVEFTCKGITFYFEGFPNMPNNTVKMRIRVDGVYTPPKPEFQEYTFNGPTGSYTFPLNLSPGHHSVDGLAKWSTNGFKGGSDQTLKNGINCAAEPEPDFSIVKTQRVQGSGNPFTSEPLTVNGGETMEYQITITNTGNVGLKFPFFEDEFEEYSFEGSNTAYSNCSESGECISKLGLKCSGGPAAAEVKPGATTQFTCERTVDKEIFGEEVELAFNEANAEAKPTEGSNFQRKSNRVKATVFD